MTLSAIALNCTLNADRVAALDTSQILQGLNDVGWTIPAIGVVYWVSEAYGGTDFKDLDDTPAKVKEAAHQVAANAAHLAGLLKASPYPG